MGRPSLYSKELCDKICVELSSSSASLRSICDKEGMPHISSVMQWLNDNKEFSEQYARAREAQGSVLADEIIEIADATDNDNIVTENGVIPNTEWIARSKLKVDARKWLATKLAPKKFGDTSKVDVTIKKSGLDKAEETYED